MTAPKEPLHPLISITLMLTMVCSILVSLSGNVTGDTTEALSKGNTQGEYFDLVFPEGGGRDPSVSILLPNSGPVLSSSLMISTVKGSPGPDSVFVDIGSDERAEWSFGGGEEGGFGLQDTFIMGNKVIRDRTEPSGTIYSLYLPKEAEVGSSSLMVSSPPTPELEGVRKVYKMDQALLSVESTDAGDIDNDGELELIYFDPVEETIYAIDVEDGGNTSKIPLVEDLPGVTTLTVVISPGNGKNGIIFSRTENGQGSVGLLIGNDLQNMEKTNLSTGLPANSSGYSYVSGTNVIKVLSGPSGGILEVTIGTDGTIHVEEKLDTSIAGSAVSEADLDGDGDKDLLIFPGLDSKDNITVCESNTQGSVEILSLEDSQLSFGSRSVGTALDIDGDGREEVYISIGPHKRIAALYLDEYGDLSMNWIGLNNTDGRPRSLPRSSYGNGTIFSGLEGLLYISTNDGLYHVLPREGPDSEHIWRKSISIPSLAVLGEVEAGYRIAAMERDTYLSTGAAGWSFASGIMLGSIDGDIKIDVDLGAGHGSDVNIKPLIIMERDRSQKTSSSGNILIRYDIKVQGLDGFLSLSELNIDYEASIDASNSISFKPAIQRVIDISDLNDIPLTIKATSDGLVRVGPVSVHYDSPPEVSSDLPRTITILEGSSGSSLFNIRDHIHDDIMLPSDLEIEIVPGPDMPPSMLFMDRNGNLVAQPFRFPDLYGDFLFAIRISDSRNSIQTEPIDLSILPTQDPPVLTGGVDEITITEGEEYLLELTGDNGMFFDPDDDELDFSCSITNPQPVTLRDTTEFGVNEGILRLFSPISGEGGNFRFEILADDGSDEHDRTLGVIRVNVIDRDASPYLGKNPGPVILIEDQDTPSRIPLAGWFIDHDTHISDYAFNVYSPDPNLDAYVKSSGGESYLYLHPKGDMFGEVSLMIEMSGDGINIIDRLTVRITSVNDVPQIFMDGKDLLDNRGWMLNGHIRDPDSSKGLVEYRIGDGDWTPAWGFESWSMIVDFRNMPSTGAFIFIRAYDGEDHSPVTIVKLVRPETPPEIPDRPDKPGDTPADDDDDDTGPFIPPGEDNSGFVPRRADTPWLLYGGLVGVIISALMFFGFTEVGIVIVATVGSSLYSKLSRKDILNHEVRGLIRGYIIANPGDHYSSIKRNLDLNNGTLAYHLRVLEQSGFIKSMYDGIYKRYYPSNVNISKLKKNVSKQEEIFNIILENPGVTMEEIGRYIGVSRQVVNYHVKNLIRAGVVSYLRDRKSAKFYPLDDGGNGFEQT